MEAIPIKKLLMRYSIPAFIGNIVIVIYNIVDRFFIGKFIGEEALAAAGVTFYLLMIFIAFSMLIGVGAGTITSIRLGQNKIKDSEKILGNAVTLFFILGIVLSSVLWFQLDWILIKFGANREMLPDASS